MQTTNIRALVDPVGVALTALSAQSVSDETKTSVARLQDAWDRLVEGLAVPPEATRTCTVCGNLGMQEARVCGFCWSNQLPVLATV